MNFIVHHVVRALRKQTLGCESGQSIAEYAVLLGTILVIAMGGLRALGILDLQVFTKVAAALH